MKLIIGGQAQGKLKYALGSNFTTNDVAYCLNDKPELIFEKKVIYNLQELVRRLLLDEIDPLSFIEKHLTKEHVVICQEVGCGVVPIDRFEREYRDTVGNVCCYIAQHADVVERVCCGIPTKIKG